MAYSAAPLPEPIVEPGDHLETFRNKLINGRFDVWQRGTNFPGPPFGPVGVNFEYTADRWRWGRNDDGGSFNNLTTKVERIAFTPGQTAVPDNPLYHLRMTADITGGGGLEYNFISQRIEGVRTLNGQKATVSFWAKGAAVGDIFVHLRYFFGSGGSSPFQDNWTRVKITTGWRRYRVVFDVASHAGKTITTGDFLVVKFTTILGATAASNQGLNPVNYVDSLDLANVQFEEGEVEDPDFELLQYETIWGLCQRYYEIGYYAESANAVPLPNSNEKWVNFLVTKRVTPTISVNLLEDPPSTSNVLPGSVVLIQQEENGFSIRYSSTYPPATSGDTGVIAGLVDKLTPGPWAADAEL